MQTIHFETPENVQISYRAGGLGHRFIAWLIDQVIVGFGTAVLVVVLFVVFAATGALADSLQSLEDRLDAAQRDQRASEELIQYALGVSILVMSFSSIVYYGAFELFLRGQTPGKRWLGLRVVKADGFALDPASVFVRNFFRPIDHLSVLWIVPVLSSRGQRFGDMAAGTVVVFDRAAPLSRVRQELAGRSAAEARFRFDHAALARLEPTDFEALEQLLDRWDEIPQTQLEALLDRLIGPLARRLKSETPSEPDRLQFLEDLMASEFRRQSRNLV